jgi:hypothetical protein
MRTRSVTSGKGQPALALRRRGISRTGDERIAWRQNASGCAPRSVDGVGPGLVAVGYGRGVGLLELHPQVLAQLVQAGVGPPVVGFDRVGGEVAEFPLVVERAGAIRLAAEAVRREVKFGPGGRIVKGAHQLQK